MEKNKRQSIFSWALILALIVFCLLLGALQYRWIGEVSVAARERLQQTLQATLRDLSRDFDAEIITSCRRLIPRTPVPDAATAEAEVSERYLAWKATTADTRLFQTIALAEKGNGGLALRTLSFATGKFQASDWPQDWIPLRERLEARLPPDRSGGPRPGGPGAFRPGPGPDQAWNRDIPPDTPLLEAPLWDASRGPFGRREEAWVILLLNERYLRDVFLPQNIQRRFGTNGALDYQVEVVSRSGARSIVYRSQGTDDLTRDADGSIGLFNVPSGSALSEGGDRPRQPHDGPPRLQEPGTPPPDRGPAPPDRGPAQNDSRWQLYVRNRAGSLEAVVARARWVNTLVTFGILVLLLATVTALVRFSRRAQRLAELQMEFVANVSHELRTPLTVIHTAAYNLKGPVAHQPKQVERYGAMIQQESARLKEIVEQVLQFATIGAGRALREHKAVSVPEVVAAAVRSVKGLVEEAGCLLHQDVDPSLPPVLGDPAALQQVLQNLIGNAVKYGSNGGKWIGVMAQRTREENRDMVEIRVLDRGPGIPEDERGQIFEPFFRGRWAVANQVHGTGLGLSLVKRVVEAHHGNVEVKSELSQGTEFIVRLPSMPSKEPYAHSLG